jgi:hypothetical protein
MLTSSFAPGFIMRIARFTTAVVASLCAVPFVVVACSSSPTMDADPFDTLQACFDEHHVTESLSVNNAIVVCCTDHPIAGVHPSCKTTQADCVTHVRAELDASVTAAEIDAACTDYISKK